MRLFSFTMHLFKTPKIFKFFFPSLVWDNDEEKVLLTFDDGPTPQLTPYILKILKQYDVKAVFFCVGENVKKHPELYNQILIEGHTIGNHTMNHLNSWKTNEEEYIKNIHQASLVIQSELFRPPYGKLKIRSLIKLKTLGYKIMMWSILTRDFDVNLSKEICLKKTIDSIKSNSILVFHDNVKSADKMKYILEYLLKNQKQLNIKI